MFDQITIQTLHKQGKSNSEIAKEMHCHRHTIERILARAVKEGQTRNKRSLLDQYEDTIKKWYITDKITILRIWEKLRDEYAVHTSYTNIRHFIAKHVPKQPEAFGVQCVDPGEVAEIDFGEISVSILSGVIEHKQKLLVLVISLPYSNILYPIICANQKLETLLRALEESFGFFCGVPKRIKVDNMKTAVLVNGKDKLEFNHVFLEFCQHYGMVITPCTPYSPEQKGTVENNIQYVQKNFCAGRVFRDEKDVARKLYHWAMEYANRRVHGTTKQIPMNVFAEVEQKTLLPLSNDPFPFFNRCIRSVHRNCHVHVDGNYYSVPCAKVLEEVLVRWDNHLVKIFSLTGEELCVHVKDAGKGHYITNRSHLPMHKVYSETEYQARLEQKMQEIGPYAHTFFGMLAAKQPYVAQTLRAFFPLVSRYGKEAVEKTCQRAIHYAVTDISTLKQILEAKWYEQPLEPIHKPIQSAANTLVQQQDLFARDLSYYTSKLSEKQTRL